MSAECAFCDYEGPSPILESFAGMFMIEPLDPVTEGHLLVIPRRHIVHAADDPVEAGRVFTYAAEYVRRVRTWSPMDANIITSIGPASSQTVKHMHLHVVPRREDDGLLLPWSRPLPP